ncbi:hypothetical protein [Oceanobacillus sp. FSL H7-0719]|uniref:hypothetical protein n=1 Tax=Oceanobacillus sp. FSL H7-0719 TaxID=2954507 RepID=UPI00324A26F6
MNFHDDITKAFTPLSRHVHKEDADYNETMNQYMYMFHDDDDIYHYKHFGDRSYLKLNSYGESVGGNLNNWRDWI